MDLTPMKKWLLKLRPILRAKTNNSSKKASKKISVRLRIDLIWSNWISVWNFHKGTAVIYLTSKIIYKMLLCSKILKNTHLLFSVCIFKTIIHILYTKWHCNIYFVSINNIMISCKDVYMTCQQNGAVKLPGLETCARKKSAAVTRKLILVTAKHLAGNKQVNVRRSLNQLK